MTNARLAPSSEVVASTDQISSQLEDEAVILALGEGVYYGLDPVGARVWELVQTRRTVDEILTTILGEYDVSADRCQRDILGLLRQLAEVGLLEVTDSPSS